MRSFLPLMALLSACSFPQVAERSTDAAGVNSEYETGELIAMASRAGQLSVPHSGLFSDRQREGRKSGMARRARMGGAANGESTGGETLRAAAATSEERMTRRARGGGRGKFDAARQAEASGEVGVADTTEELPDGQM